MAVEHGTGDEADLVGTAQRLGLACDSFGHLAQVGCGGGQQVLSFSGAFDGKQRIAANHQTFAGEVARGHLGVAEFGASTLG